MTVIFGVYQWLVVVPFVLTWALVAWLRSPIIVPKQARRVLACLRMVCLLLLCVAIAEPRLVWDSFDDASWKLVSLVDVSYSVEEDAIRAALDSVDGWVVPSLDTVNARVTKLAFAGDVGSYQLAEGERETVHRIVGRRDGTNIEKALSRAREELAEWHHGGVLLFSDGRPTTGNVDQIVSSFRRQRLPVHTVPLTTRSFRGVAVSRLSMPSRVLIRENYPVQVFVRSSCSGQVRLRLLREDVVVVNEVLEVEDGVNHWTFESSEDSAGVHRYRVFVEALDFKDPFQEDNVGLATVQAEAAPRILVVANEKTSVAPFTKALESVSLRYEVRSPRDVPYSVASLLQFSAVVLANVPSDEFHSSQFDALRRYVEDFGGGFLKLGGVRSYGIGTYEGTPIETILPVKMMPQTYQESFGLILLLDSSGSMAGYPMEWTRRATKHIVGLLQGTYLGIINFHSRPEVVVGLQKIGADRGHIMTAIDGIRSGGGTSFAPALELARRYLDSYDFSNKHVILMSDGLPQDFVATRHMYSLLNESGIQVSTIGIGSQVDTRTLQEIADACGGRFYESLEAHRMPELFEREVIRLVGPPFVEGEFPVHKSASDSLLAGLADSTIPPLFGRVGVTPKDRAQVALTSHHGDVVLAHWRFGLGQTIAFTSDVSAHGWGQAWSRWEDLGVFWGRIVRTILRPRHSDFSMKTIVRGSEMHLSIDGVDERGEYIDGARLVVEVRESKGRFSRRAVSEQTDVGRYELRMDLPYQGFYDIDVEYVPYEREETSRLVAQGAVARSLSPEFSFLPPDHDFLDSLAHMTGGVAFSCVQDLQQFDDRVIRSLRAEGVETWDVWPLLVLLGLICFVVEITVRRLELWSTPVEAEGSELHGAQARVYSRIAEQYMKMAQVYTEKGDERQAQEHYIKAHAFFVKARSDDQASRMLERYRFLERQRGG